jgi:hypothetical protein
MPETYRGTLKKMDFDNAGTGYIVKPEYKLNLKELCININNMLGKHITLKYTGRITCTSCGRDTKKSFGQGFCYPCFATIPQTEECVLRPELCRAHEGIARDLDFAKQNCLVDHYVYLALSGGLKVGVTRYHQIPTRWVDQGASKAVKVVTAKNRYNAGLIEVALKKVYADKTNWRKMLMGNDTENTLIDERATAINHLKNLNIDFETNTEPEYQIEYPVLQFPIKVISKDFEKESSIDGVLMGIKGQYLLFEGGAVINIRKFTGYNVEVMV